MIAEILPPGVESESAVDDSFAAPLFGQEQRIVRRAVDQRLREFATTRTSAHRARGWCCSTTWWAAAGVRLEADAVPLSHWRSCDGIATG